MEKAYHVSWGHDLKVKKSNMDKKEYKLIKDLETLKHKYRMTQIKYAFECKGKIELLKNKNEIESQRLKSQGIKETILAKQNSGYSGDGYQPWYNYKGG